MRVFSSSASFVLLTTLLVGCGAAKDHPGAGSEACLLLTRAASKCLDAYDRTLPANLGAQQRCEMAAASSKACLNSIAPLTACVEASSCDAIFSGQACADEQQKAISACPGLVEGAGDSNQRTSFIERATR